MFITRTSLLDPRTHTNTPFTIIFALVENNIMLYNHFLQSRRSMIYKSTNEKRKTEKKE